MAHISQKLALKPAGGCQLFCFLFQRLPGLFHFLVLTFDPRFLSTNCRAFSSNSRFVFCSSSCRLCNSLVSDCDCLSRSSVNEFASIVFNTIPILSVS